MNMKKIVFLLVISCIANIIQASQNEHWIIRQATIDDKDGMIQLRKKAQSAYNFQIQNPDTVIDKIVLSHLSSALTRNGIALVVEDISAENHGNIIAFLVYQRPMAPSYHHILDQHAMTIDPDYKAEMLGLHLFRYLLHEVQQNHSDILRIEADVPEIFTENIANFEACGFVQEGKREKAILLANGTFAADFLYVWMNPNFDQNLIRK